MSWLGQIQEDGKPDLWRVWDGTINEDLLPTLEAEARLLWNFFGGSRDEARTFWFDPKDTPRCGLERLVRKIIWFHFPSVKQRSEIQGAEFWTQLRSPTGTPEEQGLSLHFDKDEAAVEMWDIWTHPRIGTATYLTGGGAPLVVFSTASVDDCNTGPDPATFVGPEDSNPTSSMLVFPQRGRHVAFDGRLLHGVPEELLHVAREPMDAGISDESQDRLSFLVNIWTSHRPEGIKRITTAMARKLQILGRRCGLRTRGVFAKEMRRKSHLLVQRPSKPYRVTVDCSGTLRPGQVQADTGHYALREHRPGDTAPLPVRELLQVRRRYRIGITAPGLLECKYTGLCVGMSRLKQEKPDGNKAANKLLFQQAQIKKEPVEYDDEDDSGDDDEDYEDSPSNRKHKGKRGSAKGKAKAKAKGKGKAKAKAQPAIKRGGAQPSAGAKRKAQRTD